MLAPRFYILAGQEPVQVRDRTTWWEWFGKADRQVCRTTIGNLEVSTVFIGLDHSMHEDGPAAIFETVVFDADRVFGDTLFAEDTQRYATWNDAVAGHVATVYRRTSRAETAT